IPLMHNTWLAKKDKRKVALRLAPNAKTKRIDAVIVGQNGEPIDFDPGAGTVVRAKVRCPLCSGTIDDKTTRRLFREGQAGQRMMAVVLHHPHRTGKAYRLPNERDMEAYRAAEKALEKKRQQLRDAWGIEPVPDEPLPIGGRDRYDTCRLPLYGLKQWGELFNARQKLALLTFADAVRRAHAEMLRSSSEPDFAKAVTTYLGLAFDKIAEICTATSAWEPVAQCTRQMFRRQAIPMVWD
ncbi:MAG: DNA methylase, partial [Verrucomicrobiae bacterium]|nr:DNA methylase [Verrucomicrobiae bacterium]